MGEDIYPMKEAEFDNLRMRFYDNFTGEENEFMRPWGDSLMEIVKEKLVKDGKIIVGD